MSREELEDVDLVDLVDELIDRINNGLTWKIEKDSIERLKTCLRLDTIGGESIADEMKAEFLAEVANRYTESQLRIAVGLWEFKGKPTEY